MKEITINIFEHIGGNAAVSSEDGEALFFRIQKSLKNDIKVVLDFNNIELITSTFLNASVGQLYSEYNSPFLREYLKVKNMAKEDMALLKKVVDRAKDYFADRGKMEKTIKEIIDE